MAFRNALARLGAGDATVDTALDLPEATPGGALSGTVHLTGGRVAQDVTEVRVSLEATVEVESGDGEWREDVTFGTAPIAGATRLEPGQRKVGPVPARRPVAVPDHHNRRLAPARDARGRADAGRHRRCGRPG